MGRKRSVGTTALVTGAAGAFALALGLPAAAVDEIQLYNAEIAEVGQFTLQHHFNYTFDGRTTPEFPGGLVPNRALNATPEFAYGVTEWFEAGLYIPWAIDGEGQFLSNNFKLRTLFVMPNADKRDFFMGLNFEYDFSNPHFDPNRFDGEIRPIIGWRNPQWEFITNPIFDVGFGSHTYLDFLPAARLARKLAEDTFVGVEYYTDLGLPGSFPSFNQEQHQLFGVVDFKVWEVDVDFGVGYGLTPGSDRLVAKTILTYAFPAPGKSQSSEPAMQAPPTMRSALRTNVTLPSIADPFSGMR
jgi:hypothetical protein